MVATKLSWEIGQQRRDELLRQAAREETRLFCGHWLRLDRFLRMYWAKKVKCPKCGLSWSGYQTIDRSKNRAKKELWESMRMGRMSAREFFAVFGRPRGYTRRA